MITTVPDYFDEFHCLAGSCPDTCCGQWEIVVDEAAEARYRSVSGDLGQRIRAALVTMDGETCMALEHSRCPLLTAEGLCPIVTELGEDFLSETCHTHPRFTEVYGGLRETMLSISCPEAARLLLTRTEPLTFVTTRDDAPPEPNDLDGDLYHLVDRSRAAALSLLQDRTRPLSDRLALVLELGWRLEPLIDAARWDAGHRLLERYGLRAYRGKRLTYLRRKRRGGDLAPVRDLLRSLEPLSPAAPNCYAALAKPDLAAAEIPLEQLAVYFLFRWWRKASCNGYLYRQAGALVTAVLATAGLTEVCGSLLEAARLFSKEVEHSEENRAAFRRAMDGPDFSLPAILSRLEVPHAI